MKSIGEITKGGISAILIGVGYVVLWCGILCLIGSATGMMADGSMQGCDWGCLVMGAILMVSGIAYYNIVKPKS